MKTSTIPDLLTALEDLLDDTQHSSHVCGDVDCPVSRAREALAADTAHRAPTMTDPLRAAAQNVSDRRTIMDDGWWVSQKEMNALDAALVTDTAPLDAAWAEAEAALPEGWYISNVRRRSPGGRASASATQHGSDTGVSMSGFGLTPADALRELARNAAQRVRR